MRAIVLQEFGGPEVLKLRTIATPEPGSGQIRVLVCACGTNPVDAWNRRDGSWAKIEPPVVVGYDVAGVVDAVGSGVSEFAPGDEVCYMADFLRNPWGGYAEYHVANASIVARKPQHLSFIEAAAIPLAGGTAYEVIARRLAVQPGEWLLIHGAAGGVGSFAVQIAVARGARVIASASAARHDVLYQLGVAACIDYTHQDVPSAAQAVAGGKLEAVADFVGGDTIARSLPALRPYGRAATIVSLAGDLDLALDLNITLHGVLVRPDRTLLEALWELVSTGRLRPIIDQILPLEKAAEAHRRLESGHGQGKVVLKVR